MQNILFFELQNFEQSVLAHADVEDSTLEKKHLLILGNFEIGFNELR